MMISSIMFQNVLKIISTNMNNLETHANICITRQGTIRFRVGILFSHLGLIELVYSLIAKTISRLFYRLTHSRILI